MKDIKTFKKTITDWGFCSYFSNFLSHLYWILRCCINLKISHLLMKANHSLLLKQRMMLKTKMC